MKLKFKIQEYQTAAVQAVLDCFKGQPKISIDPGNHNKDAQGQAEMEFDKSGFRNADLRLSELQILKNIQLVQRNQNLKQSSKVVKSKISSINLDIEMETDTLYIYAPC